jgi:hypothetical protein
LRLRGGVWLRSSAKWVAKTPARRWDRFYDRLPKAPLPLTHYTERAGMKVPSGPKTTPRPSPTSPTPSPIDPNSNVIPINRKALSAMSDPVDTINEAFHQLATYHPGSAREVEQTTARLAEMFAGIGQSFTVWAQSLTDGQPFEQAFADQIREIGAAVAAVGGVAQEAHRTMRVAHEADFKRFEDPRPDEGMWNPESNR